MPAHKGQASTEFVSIDADGGATIRDLHYDHATAAQRMKAVGLKQGYDRALLTGYWPSEDVLPPELRLASLANG